MGYIETTKMKNMSLQIIINDRRFFSFYLFIANSNLIIVNVVPETKNYQTVEYYFLKIINHLIPHG